MYKTAHKYELLEYNNAPVEEYAPVLNGKQNKVKQNKVYGAILDFFRFILSKVLH